MAGKVFFSVSMSLDGFSAPDSMDGILATPEQLEQDPRLQRWVAQWMELQAWIFPQRFFRENLNLGEGGEEGRDNDIARETFERTGANVQQIDHDRNFGESGPAHHPGERGHQAPGCVRGAGGGADHDRGHLRHELPAHA